MELTGEYLRDFTAMEIKELRDKYDFNQQALAEKIGTTQQQISCWETGVSKPKKAWRILLEQFFNTMEQNENIQKTP